MDFIDVCRVCLKNSTQYIDLDTPYEQVDTNNLTNQECGNTATTFTYLDCLQLCTQLSIADNYGGINSVNVPRSLCDTCGTELRITYDFLQKAKRAHKILQETLLTTMLEINENVERNLKEDCKNEQNFATDIYVDIKKVQVKTDDIDITEERLQNTQQAEEELELVTVAPSSTSTLDPLSLLQEQNKKAAAAAAKAVINVKDGVVTISNAQNRPAGSAKSVSKGKSIQKTSTAPKRRDGSNERTPKKISRKNKIFLCHACPLIYRNAYAFRQHTLAHEGKRERKLTCEQCGKKFFSTTALQLHVKIHEVNRQPTFHCDKCEKSFFHYGSLYLHKRYHSEQKFKCGICGKRYVRQSHLDVHSRSHSGDLPYKCHKCDKAYQQVGLLNKHLKNYHDGYRYKCDVCGKEYKDQTTLSRHYKEHTGMPFKCSICGKEFSTNYKIRRHVGGVHKVENAEEMDQFITKVKIKKECLWQKKDGFMIINKNI